MNFRTIAVTGIAALVLFAQAGCAQSSGTGNPLQAFAKRNVIESKGFRLVVNWCEVRPDRTAECELTATSLTQDYKAGFAYPILQDQSGAQQRMVPKAGGLGQYVMIAGQPYTIHYVNKSLLPTTVKSVRGLVGSWAFWTVEGHKAGEFRVAFSDIPRRPPSASPPAQTPAPAKPQAKAPRKPPVKPFAAPPAWEVVGLWTYDGADGAHVPEGFELKTAPGTFGKLRWTHRLELKAHRRLAPRSDRILWPVYLSRTEKRVCVDAPYPSYSGYIDFADNRFDGVYAFASCKPNSG